MKPTAQELRVIAAQVELSIPTVQKVLAGKPTRPVLVKKAVLEAVQKLGFLHLLPKEPTK